MIHVVIREQGQYEDYTAVAVCAYLDKDQARQFVNAANAIIVPVEAVSWRESWDARRAATEVALEKLRELGDPGVSTLWYDVQYSLATIPYGPAM